MHFGVIRPRSLGGMSHKVYKCILLKKIFISWISAQRQPCLVYLVELLFGKSRFHKKRNCSHNCWKIFFSSSRLKSWLNSDLFRLQTLVCTSKNMDFECTPKTRICGLCAVLVGIKLWPTMRYIQVFVV